MSESWFIRTPQGQVSGPYTTAQMQALAQQGALPPTQQVLETEARTWQPPQAYPVLFPTESAAMPTGAGAEAAETPATSQPGRKRAKKASGSENLILGTVYFLVVATSVIMTRWWNGKPLPWFGSSRPAPSYSAPGTNDGRAPIPPTLRPTDESLRRGLVGTWEEVTVDANGVQIHALLMLRSDGNGISQIQQFLFGEKRVVTLIGTWTVRNQELLFLVEESSQPEAFPVGPRVVARILSVDANECRYQDVETNEVLVINRVDEPALRER